MRVKLERMLVAGTILCVCAIVVVFLFWRPFWIPAGSMKPTLLVGDYVMVSRFHGEPALGQVAVFRHPVSERDFVKRIMGMPGDTVQIANGQVILNGNPLPLEPMDPFIETMDYQGPARGLPRCANGAIGLGAECVKGQFIETLPGDLRHAVLDIGMQSSDNTGVYTVPEGHFFAMGDNRDNSTDSRMSQTARGVGFVPIENYIGRADMVVFSAAGASMLDLSNWRSDRFFESVQ